MDVTDKTKEELILELLLLKKELDILQAEKNGGNWIYTDVFKLAFENSPIGKSLTSIDGILKVNPAFGNMVGYSKDEMDKLNFLDITHPEDKDFSLQQIENQKAGSSDSSFFEKRYIHKNGTIVWAELHTFLHHDPSGKQSYFLTEILDITQRKVTEEALRASEAKFRMLFNSGRDAVSVIQILGDGRPLKFLEINDATCKRLGYSRDELLQMSLQDIHAKDFSEELSDRLKVLFRDQQVLFETEQITKDGRRIPVEVSTILFQIDGSPATLSVARDITERHQAELLLRTYAAEIEIQNNEYQQININELSLFTRRYPFWRRRLNMFSTKKQFLLLRMIFIMQNT